MDFFQPETTYTVNDPYKAPEIRPQFQCVGTATHPSKSEQRAFGFWRVGSTSPWKSVALDPDDWARGWVEVPKPDEAPSGIAALLAAVAEQLPQDDPEKCAETLAGMNQRLADRDA